MVHSLYIDPQHLTARLCRIRSIAVDDYPHFNIDTAFLQENLALQADFKNDVLVPQTHLTALQRI